MHKKCTLCGGTRYHSFVFKGGIVCEDCLKIFKTNPAQIDTVRLKD